LLTACASSHTATTTTRPTDHPITADIAGKYALYAMMSANAYHSDDRIRFPIEMLGWQQVYATKQPTTGPTTRHALADFSYDIWYKEKEDRYVFAYRAGDFGILPATQQAKKEMEQFERFHPGKSITLSGYAKGGGLALATAKRPSLDVVAFDPSPAEFNYPTVEDANRVVVRQMRSNGEAPSSEIYRCEFADVGKFDHQADRVALELLKLGAPANKELATVRDLVLFETPPGKRP
jgi:hypothetical protein